MSLDALSLLSLLFVFLLDHLEDVLVGQYLRDILNVRRIVRAEIQVQLVIDRIYFLQVHYFINLISLLLLLDLHVQLIGHVVDAVGLRH